MGVFDLFKKKEELPEKDCKWNKMWDLWAEGKAASPYAQLMTYESEVNNGGHDQYFFNTAEVGDLKTEVAAALSILPEPLKGNLQRAYEGFVAHPDVEDAANEALFSECDDVFYANEQLLIAILEEYAETMKI